MSDFGVRSAPPKVAILLLNWNGKDNTLETLESVRELQYGNFEVFLVDNGSNDGSREAVANQFPEVHLIRSLENMGVSGGWNLGLETILKRDCADYVLFLNNDVAAEPHLLEKLVAAAEAQPDLGIVGPTIYYYSDPGRIWSAGSFIVFREMTAKSPARNRLENNERAGEIERFDCISGCCMLVKRQVFEAIGGFNPQYFILNGALDFCFRAVKEGFASAVATDARLWHKVSASTGGGYAPARAYFTGRGVMLFLKDHGRPWHWVTSLTFSALSLPVAYLRELVRGNQRAVAMKLRGYLDGLLGRPVNPEVKRYFQGNHGVPNQDMHGRRHA